MFTVYVLYSESFKKHYTGFTADLEARLQSHNLLGKEWTSKFRPWRLIYSEQFESKELAIKREKWLKTGIGRDFI